MEHCSSGCTALSAFEGSHLGYVSTELYRNDGWALPELQELHLRKWCQL